MKRFYGFVIFTLFLVLTNSLFSQNRPIDCRDINPLHPEWGATDDTLITLTDVSFDDGFYSPAAPNRTNPRKVSNLVFVQDGLIDDAKSLSDYTFVWGQFIDHDITLVLDEEHITANIQVPRFDAWMDPEGTGQAEIPMLRSLIIEGTGTEEGNPIKYANAITAYIDASNVYGSDQDRADWLRTFVDGKLKTSEGNRLPYNTTTGDYDAPLDPDAPFMAMLPGDERWFVAGDVRANENILLTSMHTTFMREHNRQCDIIKGKNPEWTDEQIYQKARKIVSGIVQSICVNEWLPIMTGKPFPEYNGFDPNVNPQISNVFSAAAFRYGHTTISSRIQRMEESGKILPEDKMRLAEVFFQPHVIRDNEGVECFLKGMCHQIQQEVDCKMIDDLRNMLFGPAGAGGMDLAAINMQRGRERGLPDYNTIRQNFGLAKYTDFSEITEDHLLVQNLYEAYNGDINDIDPWVGMLAESHNPNSMFGELMETIVMDQFIRLRDGDPFFYLNDEGLTFQEKQEITNTKLGEVIARTSGMETIPQSIFIAEPLPKESRLITGVSNNLKNPDWGTTESGLGDSSTNGFADFISTPGGQNRPNPRLISNEIFSQEEDVFDNLELSDYSAYWGQFIINDMSFVPDGDEEMNITVPSGDKWMDPDQVGNRFIPFNRSQYADNSGTDINNPRKYENTVTSYIDASTVYGSTKKRADWLRTFENGKLKTSEGNLLPYNTVTGKYKSTVDPTVPEMYMPVVPDDGKWFVAGDVRANHNPMLTSIHTIFVREHNRLCDYYAATYPLWNDEKIYQEARRIVIAEIENITYNEWLPSIGVHLDEYTGYKDSVNAQVSNLFSSVVSGFVYSAMNTEVFRFDEDCVINEHGHSELKYCFFNPEMIKIETKERIEPYLLGMLHNRAQGIDTKIVDDLRNYLYGLPEVDGQDLASILIQRGRERGIVDYNTLRKDFGLEAKVSFATLSENQERNQKLFEVYGEVNDIDPLVGILAEDHKPNSIFGELGYEIMKKQFELLRDGDRFFFEIDEGLSESQKNKIRFTSLSDIIQRNTELDYVVNNVFDFQGYCTDVVEINGEETNLTFYPNPSFNTVNLKFEAKNPLTCKVQISTLSGQVMITKPVHIRRGKNAISMDVTDLAAGVYTFSLIEGDNVISEKFVKL